MPEMEYGKHAYTMMSFQNAFDHSHVFNRVVLQLPEDPPTPSAYSLPHVFIGRGVDPLSPMTNSEYETNMMLHIIIFCERQAGEELEITKAKLSEEAQALIMSRMRDNDFITNVNGLVVMQSIDHGNMSLAPLGYQGGIFPPFGAIRVDVSINFHYDVPVRA